MIKGAKAFNLRNQRFWLLSEKAIFWQKQRTLLVADLHIGKSGHFRKHGIAVPGNVNKSNLEALGSILKKTSADHLVILGDLFHSNINKEWDQFIRWRKSFGTLEVTLVIGNHDILNKTDYHSGLINLFKILTLPPFLLVHNVDAIGDPETGNNYILSGHIHPAVKMRGRGRQTLKLPCFYFGKNYGILPAFGRFTGTKVIEPGKNDRVFIVAGSQVLRVNQRS